MTVGQIIYCSYLMNTVKFKWWLIHFVQIEGLLLLEHVKALHQVKAGDCLLMLDLKKNISEINKLTHAHLHTPTRTLVKVISIFKVHGNIKEKENK